MEEPAKKKTGRPPKDTDKKTEWLGFRLTPADLEKIKTAAEKVSLSPSEYVRLCAENGTIRVIPDKRKADPALLGSLLAVGNNLNQMQKKFNSTGTAPVPAALETALTELRGLLTKAGEGYGS